MTDERIAEKEREIKRWKNQAGMANALVVSKDKFIHLLMDQIGTDRKDANYWIDALKEDHDAYEEQHKKDQAEIEGHKKFIRDLVDLADSGDIDGGSFEDILIKNGYFKEVPATQKDLDDNPIYREYDIEVGGLINKYTSKLKSAIAQAKGDNHE